MTAATEILRTRLLALPEVTALVDNRVYTLMLPQNFTGTAIRLQRITELPAKHLRGTMGFWRVRVQVDAFGPSVDAAYDIDKAALGDGAGSALAGFTGIVGTATVCALKPDTVREVYEPDESPLVHLVRDYFLDYTERP